MFQVDVGEAETRIRGSVASEVSTQQIIYERQAPTTQTYATQQTYERQASTQIYERQAPTQSYTTYETYSPPRVQQATSAVSRDLC